MQRAAVGLVALGVTFDRILTSPRLGARQTAEILAAAQAPSPPILALEALGPGAAVQAVLSELDRFSQGSVALVGHEPCIGELAARLIGARTRLRFKRGAVCRIDIAALPRLDRGTLKWFAVPKMLRRLPGRARRRQKTPSRSRSGTV